MVEPGTAIGAGLAAWASKDLLAKLLGPTVDYLGYGLREFTKRRATNIQSIFARAGRRLGQKIDTPGVVSPRILARVLEDGQYCEDALAAEYYGGLLAASRGENPQDDRALPLIEVVRTMSIYELRTHYVFCHVLKDLFDGQNLRLGLIAQRQELGVYLPLRSWTVAIGAKAKPESNTILDECFHGLGRRGIIDRDALMGSREFLVERGLKIADAPGIRYMLEPFGADLILWVSGYSHFTSNSYLNRSIRLLAVPEITLPGDAEKGRLTSACT